MTQPLGATGLPLPVPQNLYPSELTGVAYDTSNAALVLPAGATLPIAAGVWFIQPGPYTLVQWLDPAQNVWLPWAAANQKGNWYRSDGQNLRVANLTGCGVGAIVTDAGANYAQGTTTVTPTVGDSVWRAIIGGSLSVNSIVNAGSGFGQAPLVFIPGPPAFQSNGVGGVQATAYATIANGTVSNVSMVDAGAGYLGSSITGLLLPVPTDPNFGSAVAGSVTFTVGAAGSITAVLCTNPGAPLATISALSLTIAGAGASAAATPVVMQTVQSVSIAGGGTGFGNAAQWALGSAGGRPSASDIIGNPDWNFANFIPRPASGIATSNAGGTLTAATLYDGGLFCAAATPTLTSPNGAASSTAATLTFTMGNRYDTVIIQPGC